MCVNLRAGINRALNVVELWYFLAKRSRFIKEAVKYRLVWAWAEE